MNYPDIPSIEEIEPLTDDMEERLRELFQLFIDGEVEDVKLKARIEALSKANDTTERMFHEQERLTKTISKSMKPIRPGSGFLQTVNTKVSESTAGRATAWILAGIGLLLLTLVVIALTLQPGPDKNPDALRITSGTLSTVNGNKSVSENSTVEMGKDFIAGSTAKDILSIGAVLSDPDRTIQLSKGARFHIKKTGDILKIELIEPPVRIRVACKGWPTEIKINNTRILLPFTEGGESARLAQADISVDTSGKIQLAVIAAAVQVSSDSGAASEPVQEGVLATVDLQGKIISRKNIPDYLREWKSNP